MGSTLAAVLPSQLRKWTQSYHKPSLGCGNRARVTWFRLQCATQLLLNSFTFGGSKIWSIIQLAFSDTSAVEGILRT